MAMERVTVEQNGERFTLEVPEGTSDSDIQGFLSKQQEQTATPNPITQAPVNPVDYAAPTVLGTVAGAVRPLAEGAATANARDALNIAKNAAAWTPNALTEVITHPLNTLQAYVQGHPMANTPIKQIAGGVAKNVGSAVAQGLMAPENMFAAPYQMAGYEQEKIRANPTAPEYATNPYAQAYRGEYATQGQAGAANRRQAIAGQQYGGLSETEQRMLESDRLNMAVRLKAAKKVLGQ